MIIPFAPGGASDLVARMISPKLIQELGQQVVVDNRGGASGNIGVEMAARATPDGYTLLLGNIGTMVINPALYPKFAVRPVRDFIGVTQVVDVPTALAIHPSVPVATVKEFIEYAKARPGKLNFGSAGAGSNGRLEMEFFMRAASVELVHIPYKGGAGPAATALLAGEVHAAFVTLSSFVTQARAGKIKVLGVGAPRRVSAAPDTQTMEEAGFSGMTSGSCGRLRAGRHAARGGQQTLRGGDPGDERSRSNEAAQRQRRGSGDQQVAAGFRRFHAGPDRTLGEIGERHRRCRRVNRGAEKTFATEDTEFTEENHTRTMRLISIVF